MKTTPDDEKAARSHFQNPYKLGTTSFQYFESSVEREIQAFLAGKLHERERAKVLLIALIDYLCPYCANVPGHTYPHCLDYKSCRAIKAYKGTTDGE